MSRKAFNPSRAATALTALAAVAMLAALFAVPAGAASGSGGAVIAAADHSKGRTLSGQGVKLLAGNGASAADGKLTLPIGELDPGSQASAKSSGELRFKKGKKSVSLTGVHFNVSAGSLDGSLGGTEMAVFKYGATATVNNVAGSIALSEGSLRLTGDAAKALKQKLGLAKTLKSNGVGMLWIAAQAFPTHAAAQPVVSGSANWGVLASWRKYVLGNFGPGSVGTITTGGGATANGTLTEDSAYFSFPATGGSYQKGLFGAADKLTLNTAGSVTFAKPGHCIVKVEFSGVEVKIDGADSSISLDSEYDIDSPPTCTNNPAVASTDVLFAKLDLSGVVPSNSPDGKTVTWSTIPATLTAAGGTAWGAGPPYVAGKVLDPLSISVGLG